MATNQYEENRNSLEWIRFAAVICFTSGYLIAIIFKKIGALAQVGKLEKRIVFWIAFGFSILWVLNDFQTLLASSIVSFVISFVENYFQVFPMELKHFVFAIFPEDNTLLAFLVNGVKTAGLVIAFENIFKWATRLDESAVQNSPSLEREKQENSLANKVIVNLKEKQQEKNYQKEMDRGEIPKGVRLGRTMTGGQEITLTPDVLKKHIGLVGTTGSGKTITIKTFLEYAILKKQAGIFIDAKGDMKLAEEIRKFAKKHKRPFYHFNTDGVGMHYNPLAVGTPTELTDKILTLSDWSEEHYKLSSQEFLQYLFRVFEARNVKATLTSVSQYCDADALIGLITSQSEIEVNGEAPKKVAVSDLSDTDGLVLFDDEKVDLSKSEPSESIFKRDEVFNLIPKIKRIDKKAIEGLASRVSILAEGDFRHLFQEEEGNTIALHQVLEERGMVVFTLDSLRYPEGARQLGKMIVNDLKTNVSSHMKHREGEHVTVAIDEFNVLVTQQVIDVINKSRGAGFEALLAFQSLADIETVSEHLRKQIMQNCNTLIVQAQNDPSDAEELAKAIGTADSLDFTYQVDMAQGVTGLGSMRNVKNFVFHPDEIKALHTGEALVKIKQGDKLVRKKIKVRMVKWED
ncbi:MULTISPECIES: type IV secretory system conjugative DNA transfer family protein [Bacillus cereus group]|uniref:type IV secretory system conjugative DNA transfer family protein n=1 Tax=Bacillus cereus group TaxID=86661 RepID=UPI0001A17CF4|nr:MULTISPECIES: type IV secretion system DNA-binding domain-containing protein [Bacillus cereus group]MEC3059144.1 type IV secretion system DNA-binding domain-containing protein [Bacillus cereus]EEM31487.1 hypothetical protein bthur0003_60380 [Bacillus thuringiensis serovar thuringiensis str. T01001]MBG9661509.1 hypothetical protein [Bacillus thuringiensis]MEB4825436.1 type IV secretion system DNA-binding domain-containing protein [Bacillus thuringiensis]MEC2683651.1 type IV secretion system 